jgi:CBS domain-containing protein
MRVKDLMTRDVQRCRPEHSLAAAAKLMWDHDCGCVPVVGDDERVVGMLTDRDVCMAAFINGRPLHELLVDQAMSRNVVRVAPDDAIELALVHMGRAHVRRLPVVDAAGRLVGIVSLHDAARAADASRGWLFGVTPRDVGRTFAEISRPRRKPRALERQSRAVVAH